jgi:hypothetical protein
VKLRYTKRAAGQIDKALDYVAERPPQGAARMRKRLLVARFDQIGGIGYRSFCRGGF